jgi:hypothetical protein
MRLPGSVCCTLRRSRRRPEAVVARVFNRALGAGGQVDPSAIPLGVGPRIPPRSRSLAVVTTNLRPGYLRKNGILQRDDVA